MKPSAYVAASVAEPLLTRRRAVFQIGDSSGVFEGNISAQRSSFERLTPLLVLYPQ